MKKEG